MRYHPCGIWQFGRLRSIAGGVLRSRLHASELLRVSCLHTRRTGTESGLVNKLYDNVSELDTIYSLLVVKNGHLVAEQYFHEGSVDQEVLMQSATKSYISALVGDRAGAGLFDQRRPEDGGVLP